MTAESELIIGLYQRHARKWASDRGTELFFERAWLDRFRSLIPVGSAVLDLGCGSGRPIARYLIENKHAVSGVDSSPDMIAMCERHFPSGDWHVADMRTLSLGRAFNGILAWDSFFHLCHDDQRRMFPVFRRHAASRSALMFTSGPAHGETIGRLEGEPLYHASLSGAEYRELLQANGYEVVANAIEDPSCGHRSIWLAQLV